MLGIDLDDSWRTLAERFANPAINGQLARIGTDGSSRNPEFALPTIVEQRLVEGPLKVAWFTVAACIRCLSGRDDWGEPLTISDPMAATLRERALRGGPDPREILAATDDFGEAMAGDSPFVEEVGSALRSFHEEGARAILAAHAGA